MGGEKNRWLVSANDFRLFSDLKPRPVQAINNQRARETAVEPIAGAQNPIAGVGERPNNGQFNVDVDGLK